jgi:hypothetical protein
MLSWSKVAQLTKIGSKAEIRINLLSFLNGFKIVKAEIVNDTLIVSLKNIKPHSN